MPSMLENGRCVQKELQEVVQLRAEAEELQLARRTSAASEQSLQAHVGELEAQLHHCQAQLQQAQQQLGEIKPRLAASTKCGPPLPHALRCGNPVVRCATVPLQTPAHHAGRKPALRGDVGCCSQSIWYWVWPELCIWPQSAARLDAALHASVLRPA